MATAGGKVRRLVPKGKGFLAYSDLIPGTVTISDVTSEVFVCRFSPDGRMVATGCADGDIRVFNSETGTLAYHLEVSSNLPTTALSFRPMASASKTKNVLLSVNADGSIEHWHLTSGKSIHKMEDPSNQLYTLDYRSDGALFGTAGKDYAIRVYDEATKAEICKMQSGVSLPGHSNRVFALKFHPDDPNILCSGGWDYTVQVWDLRMEHSVRSMYGPHICGEALDLSGNTLLTGAWRPHEPLELWDWTTGKVVEKVKWHQSPLHTDPTLLYAACFSKDTKGTLIAAGGSGANEAKVFDRTSDNELVGTVTGLSKGVYSLDMCDDSKVVVAGGDNTIRVLDVKSLHQEEAEKVTKYLDAEEGGPVEEKERDFTESKWDVLGISPDKEEKM